MGEVIQICWRSLDYEDKDLSFMVKQVAKNTVAFAKMHHVSQMVSTMKDIQDEFDVISHNMETRMNYDVDITQALE